MDFESFRQIHRKLPFWRKLKWFYWSTKSYQRAIADKEMGLQNGQDIELIAHYDRERDGQYKRVEWLYDELLQMYEHEREMRIMYQKMAMKRK